MVYKLLYVLTSAKGIFCKLKKEIPIKSTEKCHFSAFLKLIWQQHKTYFLNTTSRKCHSSTQKQIIPLEVLWELLVVPNHSVTTKCISHKWALQYLQRWQCILWVSWEGISLLFLCAIKNNIQLVSRFHRWGVQWDGMLELYMQWDSWPINNIAKYSIALKKENVVL